MASHRICPDCGATIAAYSVDCWLCYRRLVAPEQMAHNFTTSADGRSPVRPQTNWRRIVQFTIFVLAGLLAGPAAIAAFFMVCSYGPTENSLMHLPTPGTLGAAILSGIATLAVFLGVVIVLAKQIRRPNK